MKIEIRREYISVDDGGRYEATVYREEGPPFNPPPTLRNEDIPPGYVPGLLYAFVDGDPVSLDEMLQAMRWRID
jgi:hypothetical protein